MNTFDRRTATAYSNHRRRAREHDQSLTYSLQELRKMASDTYPLGCNYCCVALAESTFTFDHRTPVYRGGSFALRNLAVCCAPCNQAKGIMTDPEFRRLRQLLLSFPSPVYANTLARLRAGAKFARR